MTSGIPPLPSSRQLQVLQVYIYNGAGAYLGAVDDVFDWKYTEVPDGAGEIEFTCWSTAANRALLVEGYRMTVVSNNGTPLQLSDGTILGISPQFNLGGTSLVVKGLNRLSDLSRITIPSLEIKDQIWTELSGVGKFRYLMLSLGVFYDIDKPEIYDGNAGTHAHFSLRVPIADDYDYGYLGFDQRYDRIHVVVESANTYTGTLAMQYMAETGGWATLNIISDGTSVGGKTMAQTGDIVFERPSDWIRSTPTTAAGNWFWTRMFLSSGEFGDVGVTSMTVYADQPTTDGLNLIMAYAPSGWKDSGYAATASSAFLTISGKSILEALNLLRKQIGGHFLSSESEGVQQIDWSTSFSSSGLTVMDPPVTLDSQVLAKDVTKETDLMDFVTRVYPLDRDGGTLAVTTRTASGAYVLDKANNFIRNSTLETAKGVWERSISFPDIYSQQEDSLYLQPEFVADALFDRALNWLKLRDSVAEFYSVSATGFLEIQHPLETIHVHATYTVQGIAVAEINKNLNIVKVTSSIDEGRFLESVLEVSTVEREALKDSDILAQAVSDARTGSSGTNRSTYTEIPVSVGSAAITGGSIDGAVIGGSDPAPGTFTTLAFTLSIGAHNHSSTALGGAIPQASVTGLTTGSSPVFVTVKLSGLTDGYIPYHVNDATGLADGPTKANVDSAISLKHAAVTLGDHVDHLITLTGQALGVPVVDKNKVYAGPTGDPAAAADWRILAQADITGLTTGSSPVFVTVKLSGLTDDYIPYHVNDATGLANGPTKTNVDSAISLKHAAVTAGTGISVAGQEVSINLDADMTWTGDQVFQGANTYRTLTPEATDTYDLGSATKLWSAGYISNLYSTIFAESTIQLIGGSFLIPKSTGKLPAVSSAASTIDFGKAMTVNDHILIKSLDTGGVAKTEYIKIGAVISGTNYNVTRDEAAAHATDPAWPDGTPYAILGNSGNGFINLDAVTTPRISIFTQGSLYSDQVEVHRSGDLNGNWGYVAATYGLAIGEYAASKANLTYDATNGLRLRIYTTDIITLSNAGAATIAGTLAMGASGSITINTDDVILNADGLSFDASDDTLSYIKWNYGASLLGSIVAYYGDSDSMDFYMRALAGQDTSIRSMAWAVTTKYAKIEQQVKSGTALAYFYLSEEDDTAANCYIQYKRGTTVIWKVMGTGVMSVDHIAEMTGSHEIVIDNILSGSAIHVTTLLADHIGEHTGSHGVVCDNTLSAVDYIYINGSNGGTWRSRLMIYDTYNSYQGGGVQGVKSRGASAASDNDWTVFMTGSAYNDAATPALKEVGTFVIRCIDSSATTEDGDMLWRISVAGSVTERMWLTPTGFRVDTGFGFGLTPIARIAHVANPSGGSTIDSQARTAINSILTTLENFGFHATS